MFAAAPDAVTDPVQTRSAGRVVKVTKVTPGTEQSFDQVKDALRARLLAEKAQDLIYDRANKVDNVLGTGASLDELPSDLGPGRRRRHAGRQGHHAGRHAGADPGRGRVARGPDRRRVQGAEGRSAAADRGADAVGGGSAYYALSVEDIIPPAPKAVRRGKAAGDATTGRATSSATPQNEAAAKLLAAVKGGQTFADAAAAAGVTVHRSPLVTARTPADGMPRAAQRVLFGLKPGEPTMVETPDGFVVAVPGRDRRARPEGRSGRL